MSSRIAGVITTFFPFSHADVIVSKFLRGFPTDDAGLRPPRVKLTDVFLDQVAPLDMGLPLFWQFGVKLHQSIRAALTDGGGKELAVDGVLLIAEHGDYPHDELGRHMYPRRYLFEQVCGVFAETGRVCPVFCDKHLSYNWADAKWMYDRARQLGVPFMAGSSLPVGCRRPWLEPPLGCRIDQALTVGYGGVEAYGYHTVELLQCLVERRGEGETGIKAVTYLEGADVWRAIDDGTIPGDLLAEAVAAIEEKPAGSMREHCAEPMAFLFEYQDGLRAATVMLNGYVKDWGFAARIDGELAACEVYLQRGYPHSHFNYLSLNIEEMFVSGTPTYPVERTLLSSGMIDAVMVSRHSGRRLATPWLNVRYQPCGAVPWQTREPRPCGANLEAWPPKPA
ncbi:MAG: hypothetical protein HUU35_15225 [Armatimonadetes bacterium]|nr:hypothetical protein [Armatimonadota bacterium]